MKPNRNPQPNMESSTWTAKHIRELSAMAEERRETLEHLQNICRMRKAELTTMTADRNTLRAQVENWRDALSDLQGRLWCALGRPVNVEYVEAVKALVAKCERLSAPVSDTEWEAATTFYDGTDHDYDREAMERDSIEEMLAARARKAQP
jgi:phage baseplate assembly protein gpV